MTDLATLLGSVSQEDNDDISLNMTNTFNLSNSTYITSELIPTTTSTTEKIPLKPSVVDGGKLKQSSHVKPSSDGDHSNSELTCMKSFCCYQHNDTNTNGTVINNLFTCKEKEDSQSNDCKDVVSSCLSLTLQVCLVNRTDTRCRIDQICENDKQPNCSIQLIDMAINASSSTTTVTTTVSSTTTTSTTVLPSTSTSTSTILPTTTTTASTTTSMLDRHTLSSPFRK
jgi:hypothetical protein